MSEILLATTLGPPAIQLITAGLNAAAQGFAAARAQHEAGTLGLEYREALLAIMEAQTMMLRMQTEWIMANPQPDRPCPRLNSNPPSVY